MSQVLRNKWVKHIIKFLSLRNNYLTILSMHAVFGGWTKQELLLWDFGDTTQVLDCMVGAYKKFSNPTLQGSWLLRGFH